LYIAVVIGLDPITRRLLPLHRFDPGDEVLKRLRIQILDQGREMAEKSLLPVERIEKHILLIRREKVMLDSDLAELYGVATKVLNQAVKRNEDRFPDDFMFQLNEKELETLRSQFVTSKASRGGRTYRPYAFTEQGVAMLSSVLKSKRAVQVNVEIMRTFVRLRQMLATHADLARKLRDLEKKYDHQFKIVFDAIRALMEPPTEEQKKRRPIGYHGEKDV
jgi:hypothetical protein